MGSVSLSIQVILISTGVLSLALLFKVSFPSVVYQAPIVWSSVVSWLRPPYLYFILNCIIITIAASSRFHYSHGDNKDQQEEIHVPAPKIAVRETDQFHYDLKVSAAEIQSDYVGMDEATADEVVVYELRDYEKAYETDTVTVFEDKPAVVVRDSVEVEDKTQAQAEEDEDDFVISKSTWIPPKRMESSENFPELLLPAEKPLVSTRFGHRKPVRASPEGGRALRVAKPKRHETLENTWKMITEGRAMPLTRHLKKSDTFENHNHGRQVDMMDPSLLPKKSQTFKDRTNYQLPPVNNSSSPATGGKLRKEPSLSQDELNRRVEAFIKKFNEEMRMQRQQSLNQYKEMIVRGSN